MWVFIFMKPSHLHTFGFGIWKWEKGSWDSDSDSRNGTRHLNVSCQRQAPSREPQIEVAVARMEGTRNPSPRLPVMSMSR
jgi:hypothetical protein